MEAIDILIKTLNLKKVYDCEGKLRLDKHGVPTIIGWLMIIKGTDKIWITLKHKNLWERIKIK